MNSQTNKPKNKQTGGPMNSQTDIPMNHQENPKDLKKQSFSVQFIVQGALIAAIYVVLTITFAPISFNVMQIRISEILTILPFFTPAAVPGLFLGCLIGNLLGGGVILDIIFGSLATLIGAWLGYLLRFNRWLVPIPSILSNAVIIPLVLKYGYGMNLSLPLMAAYVALGEWISCFVLGELFATVLIKRRVFTSEENL